MSGNIFSNQKMNDILNDIQPGFAKMQLVFLFSLLDRNINGEDDENLIGDLRAFFEV